MHARTCLQYLYDFVREKRGEVNLYACKDMPAMPLRFVSEGIEMVKISINAWTCMQCLYDFFQSGERGNKSICMQGHTCIASMILSERREGK